MPSASLSVDTRLDLPSSSVTGVRRGTVPLSLFPCFPSLVEITDVGRSLTRYRRSFDRAGIFRAMAVGTAGPKAGYGLNPPLSCRGLPCMLSAPPRAHISSKRAASEKCSAPRTE